MGTTAEGALPRLGHEQLRAVITTYRDALRAHQARLNRLNVYPVPDGDTGTNMALTLESVVAELDASGGSDMAGFCKATSHGSLMGARGNSGVILSQVLRGLCGRMGVAEEVDAIAFAEALAAASDAAYAAVMRPVEGTILTVVREAAKAATEAAARSDLVTLVEMLDFAAVAARQALDRTPELLPVLAAAGVVDAGGAGFVLLLDSFLHVADGRSLPDAGPELPAETFDGAVERAAPGAPAGMEGPRYEVMFLLDAPDEGMDRFKEAWAALGDSIVVVGGDGLWNCHIHTDEIGPSVEAGIAVGRPRNIRVTDLAEQVSEEQWVRDGRRVVTAVVAVGAGDGVARVLRELGAQEVVAGGQCMNPSTAEILAAVEATVANQVVVLPNNKNILPTAGQVPGLASRPVVVVPTRSLVEGAAALLAYDSQASAADNAAAMAKAAAGVVCGEITRAVRDARSPAGDIAAGDHLGLAGDDVVVVAPGLADAAFALLDRLVDGSHELVTIIEGNGSSAADTGRLGVWLAEHRPTVTVEVQDWGHPLSPYLFSIE